MAQVPALDGADFFEAAWSPRDGVVDVATMLQLFLRGAQEAGARLRVSATLEAFEVRAGRISGARVNGETIACEAVINAAGPWAGEVGKLAGAVETGLIPHKRHLFSTPPLPWVDPQWPFVWDVSHEVYFRPESGGLLLCACDEIPSSPCLPGTEAIAGDMLAAKIGAHLPKLGDVSIAREWAGLRTFTRDRQFVLGWDPRVTNFFWVAGLGGHGVTCSPAIAETAARLFADRSATAAPFSPARYAAS